MIINGIQNFNNPKIMLLKIKAFPFFGSAPDRKSDVLSALEDKTSDRDTFSYSTTNFLSLPHNKIIEQIKKSVTNPNNFLGKGREAYVYKIQQTPYCVRILHGSTNKIKGQLSFDISDEEKVNHVIAKFQGGITIMPCFEGYPPYILPGLKSRYKIQQSEIDEILDNMPVSAFQKFFRQICTANKNNMGFDCSWNNVILNSKDKTITAIDFYKMNEEFPDVFKPLRLCYASLTYLKADAEHKKNCAGKLLLAALEELKPGIEPCCSVNEFDFSGFIHLVYRDKNMKPDRYTALLLNTLNDIEVLKIKNIYNQDDLKISNELNGKIKVAAALIRQSMLPETGDFLHIIDDSTFLNEV